MRRRSARTVGIVVLILVVIIVAAYIGSQVWPKEMKVYDEERERREGEGVSGTELFCANNPSVDLDLAGRDSEVTTSATYRSVNFLVLNTDKNTLTNFTSDTTSKDTYVDGLGCGNAHETHVMTSQGDDNALASPVLLSASDTLQDPVQLIGSEAVKVTQFSNLQARVFDRADNNYVYVAANYTDITTATGFHQINKSLSRDTIANTLTGNGMAFLSTTNATAKTVAANGEIDYIIELKTQDTDEKCGVGTWFAVDYADDTNNDDWNADSLIVEVGGSAATEITATGNIPANDRLALTAYEEIFDLGVVYGDTQKDAEEIRFYLKADDTTNPDYNVTTRFICLGDYESVAKPGKLLSDINGKFVGFKDDGSTRTELADDVQQRIVFVVL